MQSLNGADVILDVCTSLPIFSRYYQKYHETIVAAQSNNKSLYLPLTQAEAICIKNVLNQMVTDISILWQALSLPIIQPLTPSRIEKLSQCAITALYCAVLVSIGSSVLNMSSSSSSSSQKSSSSTNTAAAATNAAGNSASSSKESDESEEQARFVVDKALEIYSLVGEMFKNNARSHIYQNHLSFGAWLLVSGIQGALGASGSSAAAAATASSSKVQTTEGAQESGKTSSKSVKEINVAGSTSTARVNLFKVGIF